MSRLLRAGLVRMFHSFYFRGILVVSFAIGIWAVIDAYRTYLAYGISWTVHLFTCGHVVSFALALLGPMFFGTEYSDGTIRNKIIAGHSRADIYLSNLFLTVLAGLCFMAAYSLPVVAGGVLLLGRPDCPLPMMMCYIGVLLLVMLAFGAIFHAITMLTANKAVSAAACLMVLILAFFGAILLDSKLGEPEFYSAYILIEGGRVETGEEEPNPRHLSGSKRELCQAVYDALPTGQLIQCVNLKVERPGRLAACSAGIFVLVTAAGVWVFGERDVK